MYLQPIVIQCALILQLISYIAGFTVDGFEGFFPIIIVNDKTNEVLIRHETIHAQQQIEVGIFPYYPMYAFMYLKNRYNGMDHETAYFNVSFEKEAYNNDIDRDYLLNRRPYAWLNQ